MKTYRQAIAACSELINMPNPETYPGKFIEWAEDICELISSIYDIDYEQVCDDLKERLGVLDSD